MQKLINDPGDFVEEMLDGVLLAHPGDLKRRADDPRAIVRADAPVQGKVAIATGGGSGHLPVFMGYVGRGLADGVAVGNVFSSPSTDQMLAVARAVHGGRGVLFLYGNYGGDVHELRARRRARRRRRDRGRDRDGRRRRRVRAPRGRGRRRGIAGIAFLYKIAGAVADEGAPRIRRPRSRSSHAAANLRSMGVALCRVHHPRRRPPELRGCHRARWRSGWASTANRVSGGARSRRRTGSSTTSLTALLDDLPYDSGDRLTFSSTDSARHRSRSSTSSTAMSTPA